MSCWQTCSEVTSVPSESLAPRAAEGGSLESSRTPGDVARQTAYVEAEWEADPARLDRVLPELGLVRSRSRATELIAAGGVSVNGLKATKPGVKVAPGSRIQVAGDDHYVGRAAHKLIAAFEEFPLTAAGVIALDVGASTGGFTQVLLERGAAAVLAIDVGHNQLAPELRSDPRVHLVEGRNARELTAENLAADTGVAARPQLVVADLSFISLTLVFPALARVAEPNAQLMLLIKPQFEVGRVKDGVVTSPRLWAEAISTVIDAAAAHGFAARGLAQSPLVGGSGNREFLAFFTRGDAADPAEWDGRIAQLCDPRQSTSGSTGERTEEPT